ncbi:phage tail sheath C-terminal domain-containing protein [Nannocystaceae bacterium ST9]
MPQALVVPGVSVATRFEVRPPLPSKTGILGAVGVVDNNPGSGPIAVTTSQELLALCGPATRYSFPEALAALANGVSELVVSPVDEGSGAAASLILRDDEGEAVVVLRARAVGPWGNRLAARITPVYGADGVTVRFVHLELLFEGKVIERHANLVMRADDANDLFRRINRESATIVAVDPVYLTDLPRLVAIPVGFDTLPSQAAIGTLIRNGAPLIELEAAITGDRGNELSIEVLEGRATRTFADVAANPALRITAVAAGAAGVAYAVEITEVATETQIAITGLASGPLTVKAGTLDGLIQKLSAHPELIVEKLGDVVPKPAASANLQAAVTLVLRQRGQSTKRFVDLSSAQAIIDALTSHGAVKATLAAGANPAHLPTSNDNHFHLYGGRSAGRALPLEGQQNPQDVVVVLVPAPDADAARLRVRVVQGSRSNTVRVIAGIETDAGFEAREQWDDLTMDPDSPRYLPGVLDSSALLRAIDRFKPSGAVTWPKALSDAARFKDGSAPSTAAYKAAIDALDGEEAVDMLLAGLQNWEDPNLDHLAVQKHMLGHARTQADKARPRLAIGSIDPVEAGDVKKVLAHAAEVGDRRFVLCTPAGSEGAIAGLLGHLEYFQSPTFKSIAALDVPLARYRDSELDKLVGPEGNLCVIQQRKGRGTICLKGIATTGDQISVTRTADVCVRRVQAIADRFIGELNNADARNALKQMIVATFLQMERDGALVPSVDGSSPAFQVDVYSSQTDFAAGIVRIDIAVRPVRAIDYVYATITVKN